jgi:hypothetical protein
VLYPLYWLCICIAGEGITLDLVLQDLEMQDHAWASLRSSILHAQELHRGTQPASADGTMASGTAAGGGTPSGGNGADAPTAISSGTAAAGDNSTSFGAADVAATVANGGRVAEVVRAARVGPRHLQKALGHVKKRTATEIGAPQVRSLMGGVSTFVWLVLCSKACSLMPLPAAL